MRRRPLTPVVSALLAAACGASSAPGGPARPDSPPPESAAAPPGAPRALAGDADFAALVASARAVGEAGQGASERGCLLELSGPEGGAHHLTADLAVAVTPLPGAPADAAARWAEAPGDRVALLSVWGSYGADGPLVLAALTTAPPPAAIASPAGLPSSAAKAVLVTPDGAGATRWIAPPDVELATLQAADADGALPAYVTATADTPVAVLARALEALGSSSAAVALAVLLPPGTTLPASARSADGAEGLCPGGLPAPGAPEGAIPDASLRQGVAPIAEAATRCTQAGTGPVARGGRVDLRLRVGPDGAVTDACLALDGIGDAGFRRCLLEAASALRFVAPQPRGVVDASLPLVLPPAAGLTQEPLCRGPAAGQPSSFSRSVALMAFSATL